VAKYGVSRRIHTVRNGRRPVASGAERNRHVFTAGRLWDAGKNLITVDAAASRVPVPVCAAGPISGPNGTTIACTNLRLLGALNEAAMATEYASAAVFVSVARYEPFGLAVLEAAQAGCALVLSDIPTFRELWDCAAIFVDPDDPAALADVLRSLTRLPARCAHLGELARQRAASFTVEAMVESTLAIHQDVCAVPATLSAA
jgi:glycosyltransferase involved in cell wall biosynthesis